MPRNHYTNGQETKELCEGDPNTPDGDWFPVPKAGPLAPWMEDANTGCIPNVTENINSECWNKLHLSEYTKWWWQTFKSVCKSHGKTTPFADCFLDKMFGGPVQCTKITTTTDCNSFIRAKVICLLFLVYYLGDEPVLQPILDSVI